MDITRIKNLAGIDLPKTEADTNMMLNEALVIPPDAGVEQIAAMFDAARRAMSLVHKLKNPVDRKKHMSSVFVNMNKIRAALQRAMDAEDAKIAGRTAMTEPQL
jgi:hypothetical protein